MAIKLHKDEEGQVCLNRDKEPFHINNGMKQSHVLAPTLFSIFSMMFKQATVDLDVEDGVYTKNCLDSSLFNHQSLQAHTNIQDFLLSDDATLVTHTQIELCSVSYPILQTLPISLGWK